MFGGHLAQGASVQVNVPAAKRWVVHDAELVLDDVADSGTILLYAATVMFVRYTFGAGSVYWRQWSGRVVLYAGEGLFIQNSTNGGMTAVVSGFELNA
jgi:hypothetical protein